MPPVTLEITQPANGAVLVPPAIPISGAGLAVALQGRVTSSRHPPLFYRWYSTLNPAPDEHKVALNWNDTQADTQVRNMTATLGVGTHIITLAAKDQLADTKAAIVQVVYAGMAGGSVGAEHPCIVHVLLASIPPAQPTALSKSGAMLLAVAPFKWNDDDYRPINKIVYSWRFEPRGDPPNRAIVAFTPASLSFVQGDGGANKPLVQYQGELPAQLKLGGYTLVLRVEHADPPKPGHEATLNVMIGA
jgi:hypothetical protein